MYMSSSFRWLHLSDIHYMIDPDSVHIRDRIQSKLSKYCTGGHANFVNCVVVTGDFFNQGQYISDSTSGKHDCLGFLKKICDICLHPQLRDDWKKHIIFCPGNHDIDRQATQQSTKYKRVICRKNCLEDAITLSPDRMIQEGKKGYTLLTKETFWLYNELLQKEFKQGIVKGNYEYSVFSECPLENSGHKSPYRVIFIGLNTSLYAGQLRNKEDIKIDLSNIQKALDQNKHSNHPNYKQSEKDYRKYLALHRELIQGEVNDEGKLCFISKKSEDQIRDFLKEHCDGAFTPLFIFLGHHPLSWFTEDARKHFANFADSLYQTKTVYLCGHEHNPKVHCPEINRIQAPPFKPVEIEVGGDFADKTTWNTPSFSIDTICFEEDNTAYLKGDIFCWCRYLRDECIDFAVENPYSYGWQVIQFGGNKEIILKRPSSNDSKNFYDNTKSRKSTSDDNPDDKKKIGNTTDTDNKIDNEKNPSDFINPKFSNF